MFELIAAAVVAASPAAQPAPTPAPAFDQRMAQHDSAAGHGKDHAKMGGGCCCCEGMEGHGGMGCKKPDASKADPAGHDHK